MSDEPKPIVSSRKSGEGLVLGAVAVAAYVGFGAVMMLQDRDSEAAHAGVPVDAVRAAVAGGDAQQPAFAVGEVIDPSRNSADATAAPIGGSRGVSVAQAEDLSDGVLGASDGAGGVTLQFQVKFDDAEAARWRERFLADPDATRRQWDEFARTDSAFAGLKLQLPPNSSGVATLELEAAAPDAPAAQEALSDDIVRRLNAAEGVDYAEPNLVGVREDAPQ
jgi:hypothetical protein